MPSRPITRPFRWAVVPLLAALSVVSVPAGAAEKPADAQRRRRQVQQERARKAAELDVLKASDAQLESALDDLNENLRGQQATAASARQAATAAGQAAAHARQAEQQTAQELSEVEASMRRLAVNAYVRGPTEPVLAALSAGSIDELTTRRHLLGVALGRTTDLSDQLREKREDLGLRRTAAEAADAEAKTRRKAAEEHARSSAQAVEVKQAVADGVETRLERALAESASLAALDQQLANEIARKQAELARRVGPVARPVRGAPAVAGAVARAGSVGVTSVRGIVVANQIADQVEALLAAAEADGFVLGGGGYRSSEAQAALRRANCGGNGTPASQCRPPTARPGQSMHEQGLAIDFTWNGSIISSRSSPAFGWLKANAGRYGLQNLPAEPWHWSTNGN